MQVKAELLDLGHELFGRGSKQGATFLMVGACQRVVGGRGDLFTRAWPVGDTDRLGNLVASGEFP